MEFHSIEPNSFYPLVLLRFRAFYEVLNLLSTDVRNVLMVDVRDTLFQARRTSAGSNADTGWDFAACCCTAAISSRNR